MIKEAQGVGISVDEAIKELRSVLGKDKNTQYYVLENLRTNVQSPQITQEIGNILGNLQQNSQIVSRDPSSGAEYPTANKLMQELIQKLEAMKNNTREGGSMSFNLNKFSQVKKDKKKSRGNPFRVLMGKVGKLLDHGLEKREIVRYLLKENIWNEETISKAVGIVKEYNKKKHKKQKKVEAQTLLDTAEDWPKLKVDYSKRSNAELITSYCWLKSLEDLSKSKNNPEGKVEDKSGVKTMLRDIKKVLLDRGMSEDSFDSL